VSQDEDIFGMLGDRLALSRLKRSQQQEKKQKVLDAAPRHTQYKGYNVENGAITRSLGDAIVNAKPISNGLIIPDKEIRVRANSADWMPVYARTEETEEKKPLPYLDLIKEVVGGSDEPKKFEIFLTRGNSPKESFFATKEIKEKREQLINTAFTRVNFKFSTGLYTVEEEEQHGYYLSYLVAQALKDSTPKGKAKCYLCNCKPRVIHKFLSRRDIFNDITQYFAEPQPGLVRTKCEELQKLLDPSLTKEQKKEELENCKSTIAWRLVEVGGTAEDGNGGVNYGQGLVAEEGWLLRPPYTFNREQSLISLPNSVMFNSNYSYYGYMQLQIGCFSKVSKALQWKPKKVKPKPR